MRRVSQQFDFLDLPELSADTAGITFALDDGLTLGQMEERFSSTSEWVDLVKFGWGTGYITDTIEEKIDRYHTYGIDVFFGGTLFELAVLQDRVEEYAETLDALGVSHVEVSAGTVSMSHDEKCDYISTLAESFEVLSEVGPKDAAVEMEPATWRQRCQREIEAGASHVILEGRASGSAGVYQSDGDVETAIIDAITDAVPIETLIFEAPQKQQQAWFINTFGPDVNLGNIPSQDVTSVRTLRLGLRGDTLQTIHGDTTHD